MEGSSIQWRMYTDAGSNSLFRGWKAPRSLSCVCSMFLQRGGSMACRITGGRQHSKDLPQDGIEVPCVYVFTGPSDMVDKTQQRLAE